MARLPLLGLPKPNKIALPKIGFPGPKPPVSRGWQRERIGPKLERLSQVLSSPEKILELRQDPTAIAPERALVFEAKEGITSTDVLRAFRNIGINLLGEDEAEREIVNHEEDWETVDHRLFFTLPDRLALEQLVSLWKRYDRGEKIERPHGAWKNVFYYLSDVRPWGPQDRITPETKRDWEKYLKEAPNQPVRLEVEFWYRSDQADRENADNSLDEIIAEDGGRVITQAVIDEINYHAALIEVQPDLIQRILDNRNVKLVLADEIMTICPQSLVTDTYESNMTESTGLESAEPDIQADLKSTVVALLDGAPMTRHEKLANRVYIDDPDNFIPRYGSASQRVHGTNMASLILHGDLNNSSSQSPVKWNLYVRPVMYPPKSSFVKSAESIPSEMLPIDLIWRAFIRMFDGEGGEKPMAPNVRVVNISIGDKKRRFANILSPWAKLLDYLAWRHNVLILVSAGNNIDEIEVEDVQSSIDFENLTPDEKETVLLGALLKNRASRTLLSPAEALNPLTIGAGHSDKVPLDPPDSLINPYISDSLPNPSSALGLGYLRSVKPEILLPGGRECIRLGSSPPLHVNPLVAQSDYFGISAAAPGPSGKEVMNVMGTSAATALGTHAALRILEALEIIPNEKPYPELDDKYYAVILKALLVHAARWDDKVAENIKEISKQNNESGAGRHQRDDVSRLLGFGTVDINRVIACTENRVTLLGFNTIREKECDEFRIPIPNEIRNLSGTFAVTATVAWLTPVNMTRREYRMGKLEIVPGNEENEARDLSLGMSNTKEQPLHYRLGKGTVFHKRWDNKEPKSSSDGEDFFLRIACRSPTGKLDEPIHYAIAITLEVEVDVAIDIYESIKNRLLQRVVV